MRELGWRAVLEQTVALRRGGGLAWLGMTLLVAAEAPLDSQAPISASSGVGVFLSDSLRSVVRQPLPPVYPAIARAAKVTGYVVVYVRLGTNGRVAAAEIVSGHPMLDQAALDAVLGWQIEPVAADDPRVVGDSSVAFSFGAGAISKAELDAQPAADSALRRCHELADGPAPATAAEACALARTLGLKIPAIFRTDFDRRARLGSGKALLFAGKAREAIAEIQPVLKKPAPWFNLET